MFCISFVKKMNYDGNIIWKYLSMKNVVGFIVDEFNFVIRIKKIDSRNETFNKN